MRRVIAFEQDWKEALRTALRTPADLVADGWIRPEEAPRYEAVLARYPMVLPRYYSNLIDRNDPACPIRLQALPRIEELAPAGKPDPLEDLAHRPVSRITHRYKNRALLHLTPNCSMSCRYCFRKTLLGPERGVFFEGEVEAALRYIETTPALEEVIFSGGDPFLANEKTLEHALERLGRVTHLRRVRFHSRVPVTLPMRVTESFARLLAVHTKPSVVVTHFNHPRELTDLARRALRTLRHAGHVLLNQSVLLSGVNDGAIVLKQLCEELFEAGALPYYLHHPDPAQGTAHFDITPERGREIHRQLRTDLPGYLVPRYVVDDPSFPFKSDVATTV